MVHLKVFAVFIFILVSVVLYQGVESQPTINSFEENSCAQLAEENQRLNVELDNERRLVQRYRQAPGVVDDVCLHPEIKSARVEKNATVKLIRRISLFERNIYRVIQVLDIIYILRYSPNSSNSINVFEDRNQFRFLKEIALSGTNWTYDMVYSKESKCFYIRDVNEKCIWRMTAEGDHRLTKWLTNLTFPSTLSLSNEGHLLVLRTNQPSSQLDIYSLSANLIRSIPLPYDVKNPHDVVQTSNGYYVILHELTDALNGSMVISQVNNAGQLMNRFTPKNQFQVVNDAWKLFCDSGSNRLFVADKGNHRVILFDSIRLSWIQVLLSQETEGIWYPWSVFYDANKKQLLLTQNSMLDIYELA